MVNGHWAPLPANISPASSMVQYPRVVGPGQWVDLLAWAEQMNLNQHGYNWYTALESPITKDGAVLLGKNQNRYPLPAIIKGDYEMEVEFTRLEGMGGQKIFFPVGMQNLFMDLQIFNGIKSGVHNVDGLDANDPKNLASALFPKIDTNQRYRMHFQIERNEDEASFQIGTDKKTAIMKWKGNYSKLHDLGFYDWKLNQVQRPWLGTDCRVNFQKVRVKMLNGEIHRDTITRQDREEDLKNGYVRLIGEPRVSSTVGYERLLVNQFLSELANGALPRAWPITEACLDYYFAHAPSNMKCPIPVGAKSFSVIGLNEASGTTRFQAKVDGKILHDSGISRLAILRIDLPADAKELELIIDPDLDNHADMTKWCYPRFHKVDVQALTSDMIDSANYRTPIVSQKFTGDAPYGGIKHSQESGSGVLGTLTKQSAKPCHEFLFAHAPSVVKYEIPPGMLHFTVLGHCIYSNNVSFEVWADGVMLYKSPAAGKVSIDIKLPDNAKILELRVNELGDPAMDRSMWCYPRLYTPAAYEAMVVGKPSLYE